MIHRMLKVFASRYACALSAAVLAALLSACSPNSPTAAANPGAREAAPAKAATVADLSPDLPEIVITASRIYGPPTRPEPKSVRVRTRSKDKSS